jgi:hypothetical protein
MMLSFVSLLVPQQIKLSLSVISPWATASSYPPPHLTPHTHFSASSEDCSLEKGNLGWAWCFMPVIPAPPEDHSSKPVRAKVSENSISTKKPGTVVHI